MALTATCTSETLKVIEERLSLEQPDVIASSPQRSNIFFCKKPPIIIDIPSNIHVVFHRLLNTSLQKEVINTVL